MQAHFPDAIPTGVRKVNGDVVLVPDRDYIIQAGEKIIVIAEDDNLYEFVKTPSKASLENPGELPNFKPDPPKPDKVLVCGAGENLKRLLQKLPIIFMEGTEVHLVNTVPLAERERMLNVMDLHPSVRKCLIMKHFEGNPALWHTLKNLDLPSYHCVLVVSDATERRSVSSSTGNVASDSQNLATILLLRNHSELKEQYEAAVAAEDVSEITSAQATRRKSAIKTKMFQQRSISSPSTRNVSFADKKESTLPAVKGRKGRMGSFVSTGGSFNESPQAMTRMRLSMANSFKNEADVSLKERTQPLFVEIKDTQTQQLIEAHPYLEKACHFLVSNRLVSKVISMVAEDRTVRKILDLLLGGDTTMYLVPSEQYVESDERVSFFMLAKRAQKIGQVMLGYQHKANVELTSVNPKDKTTKRRWGQCNFIVMEQTRHEKERRRKELGLTAEDVAFPAPVFTKTAPSLKKTANTIIASKRFQSIVGKVKEIAKAEAACQEKPSASGLLFSPEVTVAINSISPSSPIMPPPIQNRSPSEVVNVVFSVESSLGLKLKVTDPTHINPLHEEFDFDLHKKTSLLTVSGLSRGGQAETLGVALGWVLFEVEGRGVSSHAALVASIEAVRAEKCPTAVLSFKPCPPANEAMAPAPTTGKHSAQDGATKLRAFGADKKVSSNGVIAVAPAALSPELAALDPEAREMALLINVATLQAELSRRADASEGAVAAVVKLTADLGAERKGYEARIASLEAEMATLRRDQPPGISGSSSNRTTTTTATTTGSKRSTSRNIPSTTYSRGNLVANGISGRRQSTPMKPSSPAPSGRFAAKAGARRSFDS